MTHEANNKSPNQAQLSQQIAQALGETAALPIRQIAQLVDILGAERAQALLRETLQLETAGGMLIEDGSRRRTPGGVFFKLAREQLTKDQRITVFGPRWGKHARRSTNEDRTIASQSAVPLMDWAERGKLVQEAIIQPGKATTVKVTLIGRPGKVVARQDFTLLLMKHSGTLPALPKGVPVPATVPETSYIVYVGGKQWRGVTEALKNPDDVLIVEGTQFYDKEHGAITVFATNTTTKALQQAKRQAQ